MTIGQSYRDLLMFIHALIAFIAVPGLVAFAIPASWLGYAALFQPSHPLGLLLIAPGSAALLWCVRDFYVAGKGTLAPWAPPEKLVTVGLYRYSRNPMYTSVAFILFGWAIFFASASMLLYALFFVALFHLRVVYGEEPWLARTFGKEWQRYASRVPRWIRLIRHHHPLKINHRI